MPQNVPTESLEATALKVRQAQEAIGQEARNAGIVRRTLKPGIVIAAGVARFSRPSSSA